MNTKKETQLSLNGKNPFGTQAKLFLHKKQLGEYLLNSDTSSPIFMEIGLTDKCNMNCKWCITENGRDNINGVEIDINTLTMFLSDFAELGGKAITFCGMGEPTKYSHFIEASHQAKKFGLELGLMSNGVYPEILNEVIGNNFKWARFSIDTINEEKYFEWKKLNGINIVKKNIQQLKNYPISLGVNCNIGLDITINDIEELINWVNLEEGIRYLQFRPILPRYYKNEIAQLNKDVWDFLDTKKNNLKIILSDDKRNDILNNSQLFNFRSCEGHFFVPILEASGNIKVCTYHSKNEKLCFGNIYNNTFKEIWKSKKRKEAIDYVRTMDYAKECQACCKLAEINKLIDFINHPEEVRDKNFL